MTKGREWQRVLDGTQKPKGWIRTDEARRVLSARAEDFAVMSARYAKAQLKKATKTGS